MSTETRTNQSGSVVSFLVIGAILAIVVIGAIYTVQNRNNDPKPSPSPSVSQSSGPELPGQSPSTTPTASPVPSRTPTASSQPATPPATTDNLPATGPADDLVMLSLPIAALVGMSVAYVRSRHDASHRLNR